MGAEEVRRGIVREWRGSRQSEERESRGGRTKGKKGN